LGTFGSPTIVAKMSLVNTGDTNHMNWDGSTLDVKGTINATAGNFSGFVTAGTLRIGTDVDSTNDGLYFTSNTDYIYDTGNFRLGNGNLTWNGSGLSVSGAITATSGYISSLFTIGDSSANRIFLDAQTSTRKIYIGAGNFDNSDTNFYVDTSGKFSLGNRFKFETTVSGFGSYITANSIMYISDLRGRLFSFDFGVPGTPGCGMFLDSGFVLGGGGGYNASVAFIGTGADAYFDKSGTFTIENIYVTGGSISGITSLSVTGAITATGDITANTSDKRLKENVKQIENALDKVSKINGITYNFTDDALILNPALNKSEQVGFLAQEVQSVLPHIIKPAPFDVDVKTGQSISGENYLTIQYEKIVPLLLEAIKELKAEVEELKKK
jgi:hypothetical protein